jgi:pimeloyl-ACP methyl ester carboxylesterase
MQRFRALTLADIASQSLPEQIWRGSYEPLVADGSLQPEESALFRAALSEPAAIHGGMDWYRANIPPFADITSAHRWPALDPKVRSPAMLIWGLEDRAFVGEFVQRTRHYADKLTIVELPGIGHWTTMQRPARANEVISDFLANLAPAPDR